MMRRQAPRVNRTGVAVSPAARLFRADEMRLGDGELLVLGVAGQDDDLEPVAQRVRDAGRVVGGGGEQHLREVEGELDEGVAEAVVLRGVEDLEQDGGGRGAVTCLAG